MVDSAGYFIRHPHHLLSVESFDSPHAVIVLLGVVSVQWRESFFPLLLQMGFRTLAIQKRTGEVWTVLGAVKTEFSKFGGLLEKVQKNLQSAGDQLEDCSE